MPSSVDLIPCRVEEFMLQDYLSRDPNLVRCPKESCQTPMIHEATTAMVVCPNKACNYTFCKNCKVEWHSDSTCEQYQEWKRENGAAEDLFSKWAERNTKNCPKAVGGCGRSIQKNGGCNHMTYVVVISLVQVYYW